MAEPKLVKTTETVHDLHGSVEIARYTCEGQPDRWLIDGQETPASEVMPLLSQALGRKVVFGKIHKPKKKAPQG